MWLAELFRLVVEYGGLHTELLHLMAERSCLLPHGRPDGLRLIDGHHKRAWCIEQAMALKNRGSQLSRKCIGAWHHHPALRVTDDAGRRRRASTLSLRVTDDAGRGRRASTLWVRHQTPLAV